MGNPLIWVMCVGALCAAILGRATTVWIWVTLALVIAFLGNVADAKARRK